jgi:hypothetical protein
MAEAPSPSSSPPGGGEGNIIEILRQDQGGRDRKRRRVSEEAALDRSALREAIEAGHIEWQLHALERILERGVSRSNVFAVLHSGEQIEDYPDDKPFPSALFLGWIGNEPLHVVAALDLASRWAYIITAYRPDLEHFEPDFKTRRKP